MGFECATIADIIEGKKECPLPLEVIPNKLGINLVSVESVSWQKTDDNQLKNLTIHFIPAKHPASV